MRLNRRTLVGGILAFTITTVMPAYAFTSHAPVTVVGDSLSIGLAMGLQDMHPDMPVQSLGVVSSGLTNPRFVDWQARIREVAATRPPLVLVMVGMNDSGAAVTPDYSVALASFLMPLANAAIRFVVISVPRTDDSARNRNIDHLNTLYEMTTLRLGGQFVQLPAFERAKRSPDGIHFTKAGYRELAASVLAQLHTASWKRFARPRLSSGIAIRHTAPLADVVDKP